MNTQAVALIGLFCVVLLAAAFVGMNDFRAFSDDDPDEKSTTVLLEEVTLVEADDLVLVRVAGSQCLWKMVRRMVGVLLPPSPSRAATAFAALARHCVT